MMTRRSSESATPAVPVAPVVKRKRRASCLGEQERRERKRAIDREAQRSLREKTKSHIADLERTIQILRDQDRNSATANLLSEIETLRSENERLRDVIENVRNLVGGGDLFATLPTANGSSTTTKVIIEETNDTVMGEDEQKLPPTKSSSVQPSPKPPQRKPSLAPIGPSPQLLPQQQHQQEDHKETYKKPTSQCLHSPPQSHTSYTTPSIDTKKHPHHPSKVTIATQKPVDLDGMVMTDLELAKDLNQPTCEGRHGDDNMLYAPGSPTPAAWIPLIAEIWGRCPSPTVIHLGRSEDSPTSPSSSSPFSS